MSANSQRGSAKARRMIKAIKPREYSHIRQSLKFANCVSAMRTLTDAMEELSAELVANEKYNRLQEKKR